MGYLQTVDIQPPVYAFLTVTGVQDMVLAQIGESSFTLRPRIETRRIDRDVLMLPDVVFDDLRTPVHTVLRPALDALWQASGLAFCPCYDGDGEWKVQ